MDTKWIKAPAILVVSSVLVVEGILQLADREPAVPSGHHEYKIPSDSPAQRMRFLEIREATTTASSVIYVKGQR